MPAARLVPPVEQVLALGIVAVPRVRADRHDLRARVVRRARRRRARATARAVARWARRAGSRRRPGRTAAPPRAGRSGWSSCAAFARARCSRRTRTTSAASLPRPTLSGSNSAGGCASGRHVVPPARPLRPAALRLLRPRARGEPGAAAAHAEHGPRACCIAGVVVCCCGIVAVSLLFALSLVSNLAAPAHGRRGASDRAPRSSPSRTARPVAVAPPPPAAARAAQRARAPGHGEAGGRRPTRAPTTTACGWRFRTGSTAWAS